VKYAFVERESQQHAIAALCRVVGVSRSGFYAWRTRGVNRFAQANEQLRGDVERIHYAHREAYGTRRIKQVLAAEGHEVSRGRIAQAKRVLGLWTQRRRRHQKSQRSKRRLDVTPNRLQRCFSAESPNQIWVADVTSVWTQQGWLHVAAVMDLYARRIVGWASGKTNNDRLTGAALEQALAMRRPMPGLLHHSDRGFHYTGERYRSLLTQHGLIRSLSRAGDCYDNAAMESFFSSLKNELTHHEKYTSRAMAREAIYDYIECFYNRQRMHSTLGNISPAHYEKQYAVA
jgi:putative transposase